MERTQIGCTCSYNINRSAFFPRHLSWCVKESLQGGSEVNMKMAVFWDVAPCSLVDYRRLRGVFCLHHQGDEEAEREELV
jgi:hypothetical protein